MDFIQDLEATLEKAGIPVVEALSAFGKLDIAGDISHRSQIAQADAVHVFDGAKAVMQRALLLGIKIGVGIGKDGSVPEATAALGGDGAAFTAELLAFIRCGVDLEHSVMGGNVLGDPSHDLRQIWRTFSARRLGADYQREIGVDDNPHEATPRSYPADYIAKYLPQLNPPV